MKNSKGFNLVTVIIIICLVSIVSGITTGIIVINSYQGVITDDSALNEFLKVYNDITKNYYEEINKGEMLDKAVDAMLEYLGDSYTTYLNNNERESLEEKLSGTYQGIGVTFANRTIVEVMENTPAEAAGLQAGDIFVKIGSKDVSSISDNQIKYLIKNSNKDLIDITILRGEEELEFTLEIKTLNQKIISSTMIEETNIGYIDIPVFARNLASQVNTALNDLEEKGMDRLIIDLRDDTGGYLDEAQKLASIFLEQNKLIYSLENKDKKEKTFDETNQKKEYPIVILINGNSASAAEILAAALKDSYGATIVGKNSYGKGKVQQTYTLSDGGMAKYTSAKWFRPNGDCIDGKGILPDIEVDLEYTYDEEGNRTGVIDTQLNKAIEIIGTL